MIAQMEEQPVQNRGRLATGIALGAIVMFFVLTSVFGTFFVYYVFVLEPDASVDTPVRETDDRVASELFTDDPERTSYSVNYDIGYDDGYFDGAGFDTAFGDSYFEFSSSEIAQAYHDGYLDGYFDGCLDGDWDCEYLNDALRSGFTGFPGNDVLHSMEYDLQTPFDPPQAGAEVFSASADVYEARNEAVVAIYDGYFGFVGSGVIIDPNGLIVTNHHVLNGLEDPYVQDVNGNTYELRALSAVSEYRDLAIFWVYSENQLPFVPIELSDNVRVGEEVVTIGSPEGYINTLSTGELSGKRNYDGLDYLQTTAPITYGSSGGALLELSSASLIGIITSGYDTGNLNFAVPTEDIFEIMGQ